MNTHRFAMKALTVALAAGGIAFAAHAQNLSAGDRQFAEKAAIAGIAEVDAGKLAEQKAQDSQVKQFGQRMVHDHTQANDRLKQIAADKKLDLPTKLDKHAQKEIDKLEKLSGDQFDEAYIKAQVSDHQKVIDEFQKEAKSGKDNDLVKFAQTTLPTLQEHLDLAKSAQQEVGGKSASNMKKENKQNLAAARAGTGATRVQAEKEDHMPVPKTGM